MLRLNTTMLLSPSISVITSEYAPVPILIRYPRKGPYYQRRLKKLKRDPNNWTKPEVLLIDGAIVVHPSLYYQVQQLVIEVEHAHS